MKQGRETVAHSIEAFATWRPLPNEKLKVPEMRAELQTLGKERK